MAIQRAVVKSTLGGVVEVRNVFTADLVLEAGESPSSVWNGYLPFIYDHVKAILRNTWTSYEYEILIPVAGQWETLDVVSMVKVGAGTTQEMPNAVAAVMLGFAAGVRHVGRKFFSGIGVSMCSGNDLGATALADLASALAIYIMPFSTLSGSTFAPGVVDKAGDFHPFVGGVVSSILGSQRRRKPGVGI